MIMLLLAILAIVLIYSPTRQIVFWGVVGLFRRLSGRTPAMRRRTRNRIEAIVQAIGWLLVAIVLINVVGIAYANLTVLAVEAALIATIAYLLFKFSSKWGARTAFVLYGLAILGFLWPASIPVSPKTLVVILLALPMLDILWHVGSRPTLPGVPVAPAWIKWAAGTAMVTVIIAAAAVITVTQVGWLDLRMGRVMSSNNVLNDQAIVESEFHKKAEAAKKTTVGGILYTLGNEMDSGAPDPTKADADFKKLEAQKAVEAKAHSVAPNQATQARSKSNWLPHLDSFQFLLIFVGLAVAVAILLPNKTKTTASH